MSIAVLLILAFALPTGAARAARSESLPDLPRLNLDNFLPAVREQVRQANAAAEAHPKDADASGELGMVLDAYEQYDAAAVCYQRAHLLDPGAFRWLYYLGWVQAAQGQHEDAVATLGEAVRLKPEDRPAALRLAGNLLAIGRLDQAGDIYRTISETHPESAEAHYGLGRVAAARGDATAAAAAYLKSCELFPAYAAAHYALALAYRMLGRDTESRQQFALYQQNRTAVPPLDDPLRREVAALNRGSVAHLRRGADLEQAGRIAEAITEQQEALRVDPQAVQAHINLISLYGRQGQYDEATAHYRAALTLDPHQADVHYNYGVLLLKQGKPQEAVAAFQEAVRINPSYVEAHNHLGSVYEQQGRLDEAFRQFTLAVENRPGDRGAHFHMGRILTNQRKYGEAIQHLLKALTPEDENTPRYLYALGATYARAGNLEDALKYTRTARAQAAARGQDQLLASIEKDLRTLEQAAASTPKQ